MNLHRRGSLWVPDAVELQLQRGLCSADGDVLTLDGTATGGSGVIKGETQFAWKPPAGGGGTVTLDFSLVDIALAGHGPAVNAPGNQTVGAAYYATRALTINGVRVYWVRNASDRTVNLKIWSFLTSTTGTGLAIVDIPVTATGIYMGTFGAPVALAARTRFMVTMWEKSGSEYIGGQHGVSPTFDTCIPGLSSQPVTLVGAHLVYMASRAAGANTFPNAAAGALGDNFYPVEPLIAA